MTPILFLGLSSAFAAGGDDQLPVGSTPNALALDVYIDMSQSTVGQVSDDIALVEMLSSGLRPEDRLRITGFDGTLHAIAPMSAPGELSAAAVFKDVTYTGLATFFSPIWADVYAQAASVGSRTHIVVVATDGESDPLNKRAKDRPELDDPTWKDAPPAVVDGANVIFVVRDPKTNTRNATTTPPVQAFAEGAIPARWTEPSGKESTIIFWNPPDGWTQPWAELPAWVESLRPVLPPPALPEEPPVDWGMIGGIAAKIGAGIVGVLAVVAAAVVMRRTAASASTSLAAGIQKRTTDRVLKAGAANQALLRIEPLGIEAAPEERRVSAGEQLDVGPAVSWPGVPLPLPGGGFSLVLGDRLDRATIQPRGTRSGVALLRAGYILPIGRDVPVEIGDGDVVIDARSETPLVRIHLGATGAALGRTA